MGQKYQVRKRKDGKAKGTATPKKKNNSFKKKKKKN